MKNYLLGGLFIGGIILTVVAGGGGLNGTAVYATSTPPVNHAPVLDTIGVQTVAEGEILHMRAQATDPDGDPITYTYVIDYGVMPYGSVSQRNATSGRASINTGVLTDSDLLLTNAIQVYAYDSHGDYDSQWVSINVKSVADPRVGQFDPSSGMSVSSTTPISFLVNTNGVGLSEVNLFYRSLGSSDPLKELILLNDPINNPEYSTTTGSQGTIAKFTLPLEPSWQGMKELDFELWIKDKSGQYWWSGWGGNWIMYMLRVNY